MLWMIIGLLVLIVILLGAIAWNVEKGLEWIGELTRASGQANVESLKEVRERLAEIERHVARATRPFYEADAEDDRRRREDPASYYWERDDPMNRR